MLRIVCGGVALITLAAMPGFGATFTFNFNSLSGYNSGAMNQATSIASQLQSQLQVVCPSCTVTATSGTGIGAVIDKTYTADGYVVGPKSGSSVISETLGNTPGPTSGQNNPNVSGDVISSNSQYTYSQLQTQGYTNQFLANTNDSDTNTNQLSEISFQFGGMAITGASFNYEVFPDATGTQPDLTFEAGNNTSGTDTQISQALGATPSLTSADGSSVHSPKSGSSNSETHQQYIGNWSGTFSSSSELDFVDWPATIGIDNLSITYSVPGSPVPEPRSVILLATVAAAISLVIRRKASRA